MFLVGKNVSLRALTEDDFEGYFEWLNDQNITKWMQRGIRPNTMESMHEYLKHNLVFAIMAGGQHIGNITLANIHQDFRSAEITIMLGREQGKGNGTEAIQLLTDHCFRRMNLNRVQAGCVYDNATSFRAFAKAGFTVEGTLRKAYYCDGEYRDVVIMSILKNEWRNKVG
jgi:RimJ/RimL family protein N-acetyltransferase